MPKIIQLKNLGKVRQYLDMNETHLENDSLLLDQEAKINEMVNKLNLGDSKPTYTPMSPIIIALTQKQTN